jgi:hypothetical protein
MSETGEALKSGQEAHDVTEAKRGRAKAGKVQSLKEKLEKLEREAETVRQKLQEQRRKEREGNARQIAVFAQKEDLADFSIETWRVALPKIRAALESAEQAEG